MSDSMSDSVKPTVSDPVSPAAGARTARLPRYAPLLTFLADMDPGDDEKTLTFQQVELLLGHKVPASAREHVQWWANTESHVQAQSWLRAGWRVDGLSLAQEWVRFRRQER